MREAFLQNFRDGLEVGAATSVVIDGETVVDLWAGHVDENRTRSWNQDTIVQVMSVTKAITALLANRLVERGVIELDLPVAKYWPEFAAGGKGEIPVRHLLTHLAGLPALEELQPPGTVQDWGTMTRLLANQKPLWEPGSTLAYHAVTFGFLVGEVIRRATGKTVGQLVREEITGPLGVSFELGFGKEVDSRVADLLSAAPAPDGITDLVKTVTADPLGLFSRAFLVAMPTLEFGFNTRASRGVEVPAVNGHTNARSLAKIYGALSRGGSIGSVRLLEEESLASATSKQVGGLDAIAAIDMHLGLGFMLRRPDAGVVGSRAFGHPGYGGALGFADPDRRLGFGYVMNQLGLDAEGLFMRAMAPGGPEADPRSTNILRAVYAAL